MKITTLTKEEFYLLPVSDRQILIAKDVIVQINNLHYQAESGGWLNLRKHWNGPGPDNNEDRSISIQNGDLIGQQLQPVINSSICHVCAVGSLFTSVIGMFNDFKLGNHHIFGGLTVFDMTSELYRCFTRKELIMIEIAFEGGAGAWTWYGPDASQIRRYKCLCNFSLTQEDEIDLDAALAFYNPNFSDRDLMLSIMHNIVNNGEFKPQTNKQTTVT